jgi:ATP-dependent RNA helicase DDX55/SPB4
MLKANAAFVSFVRAYQEHKLKFIFSWKEVDVGLIAQSFGVLRIPRVKEILGKKIENFDRSEVVPDDVAFVDAKKEEARQVELKQAAEEEFVKKESKREKPKPAVVEEHKRSRSEKRETKRKNVANEWNALASEERLVKKLRAGKITQEQFDELVDAIGHSDTESESEVEFEVPVRKNIKSKGRVMAKKPKLFR